MKENGIPKGTKDFFFPPTESFYCKITLLTLLTVRARYITRQYNILPTIQCLLATHTTNNTGLYLQFNTYTHYTDTLP